MRSGEVGPEGPRRERGAGGRERSLTNRVVRLAARRNRGVAGECLLRPIGGPSERAVRGLTARLVR